MCCAAHPFESGIPRCVIGQDDLARFADLAKCPGDRLVDGACLLVRQQEEGDFHSALACFLTVRRYGLRTLNAQTARAPLTVTETAAPMMLS